MCVCVCARTCVHKRELYNLSLLSGPDAARVSKVCALEVCVTERNNPFEELDNLKSTGSTS